MCRQMKIHQSLSMNVFQIMKAESKLSIVKAKIATSEESS